MNAPDPAACSVMPTADGKWVVVVYHFEHPNGCRTQATEMSLFGAAARALADWTMMHTRPEGDA